MDETMGQRIARFRRARGMTQAVLGARVGTSKGYIAQLEGDFRANPSKDLCVALATALGVSLDELVLGASPNALSGRDAALSGRISEAASSAA